MNADVSLPASRASDTLDDATLIRQMATGDAHSMAVLYDRWHPRVHSIVSRILGQHDAVDDVVEETFWQSWRQARRYDSSRAAVQSWLLTIARGRALDRVRGTDRQSDAATRNTSASLTAKQAADGVPEMDAKSAQRRTIVLTALAELPVEQRDALELGYFSGLSQSEIAERSGQPLDAIKTHIRLAMQKLRGSLQVLREDGR